MRLSKLSLGALSGAAAVLMTASQAFAQAPILQSTWVSGTVYNQAHTPVNGGSITVHCGASTKSASISSSGTYGISFDQSECKVGDTASATASTGEGSGSNSAPVENTVVNGPIVDLDVAVIDITVPEFGMIGGMVTAIGAAGTYLYMRAKSLV